MLSLNQSVSNLNNLSPLRTPKAAELSFDDDVTSIIQTSISNVSEILRKSVNKRSSFMNKSYQQLPSMTQRRRQTMADDDEMCLIDEDDEMDISDEQGVSKESLP